MCYGSMTSCKRVLANFLIGGDIAGQRPRSSILFLIYVNDLPSLVPGGLLLQYADDNTLICSAPDAAVAEALMNSHLEVISQWTTANRMRLNLSKSSVMWFRVPGQRRTPYFPEVLVANTPLTVVSKQVSEPHI